MQEAFRTTKGGTFGKLSKSLIEFLNTKQGLKRWHSPPTRFVPHFLKVKGQTVGFLNLRISPHAL